MKRKLRHPITSITEPFGKAGVIVACLALVFAMAGGALAAKGALTSKQKKEVKKIAKKYAGKPGAPGATGPAGPAGAPGKNGTDGTNGSSGMNGKSVVVTGIAKPGCGGQGGAAVEVENEPSSKQEICNGQTGFTETLPKGKTETGTWNATGVVSNSTEVGSGAEAALSLSVPLTEPITEEPALWFGACGSLGEEEQCTVHLIKHGQTPPSQCPGTVAEPAAEEGNVCIFIGDEYKVGGTVIPLPFGGSGFGMGISGTNLALSAESGATEMRAAGTFAVTPST